MVTYPRTPASRAIADLGEEAAMDRVNQENEDRLSRAIANGLNTKPKVEPMIGDNPLPGWPAKREQGEYLGSVSGEVFAPAENDPVRGYTSLGRSPVLTRADIEGDPQYDSGSEGVGGPLNDADIIELRKVRDRRKSEAGALAARQMLLEPTTPDQAAADLDLAEKAGVQPVQVEQDRDGFRAAQQAREIDLLEFEAPKVRSWINDPANFRVAHDDLDNLAWWERAGKIIGAGAESALPALGEGIAGTSQMVVDFVEDYLRSPSSPALMSITGEKMTQAQREAFIETGRLPQRPVNEEDLLPQASRALGSLATAAKRERERLTPTGMNDIEAGIYSGFQSLLVQSPGIALSAITKTPLPAIGTATIAASGPAYVEAREQGLSVYSATEYAVTQGAIEYVTEKIPMSQLFGDIATKTPFWKTLRNNLIAEGGSEQAATLLQDASTWASLNPDKTLSEFLAERPSAALQTAVATVVQSGAQTTLAQGVSSLADQFQQTAQQRRAEDLQRTIEAMAQGAKDSKLLKRLPDKYRDAVNQIAKDGPLESVRVTSEAVNEFAQANNLTPEKLAQAFRIDPDDMIAAIQSGEDVVIPAGNYAAILGTAKKELGISGETIHGALAPNMRLRADDFTAKERDAMQTVFEEEQKARTEGATQEQAFADSADRVREVIREQVAGTKLFNTEAANTQATIAGEMVATLAERTGQDPEALWKEAGFDVATSLTSEETDSEAFAQGVQRQAIEVDDESLAAISEKLSDQEFEVYKAAIQGGTNDDIADRINELRGPDNIVPTRDVAKIISRIRDKGVEIDKLKPGPAMLDTTRKVLELKARGLGTTAVARRVYPDRDIKKAVNLVNQLTIKNKAAIEARKAELAGRVLAQSVYRGIPVKIPPFDGPAVLRRLLGKPSKYLPWRNNPKFKDLSESVDEVVAEVPASLIVPGQSQIRHNFKEVGSRYGDSDADLPLLVREGGKYYIRDGTHRIASQVDDGASSIRARVIDLDAAALAQGDMRGSYTPRADRSIIRLFESANLSTFVHEASHWYLDTLWKMSQVEAPHPFVQDQLAAILEWKGKSPNWTNMFDAEGRITDEGRDVQEAFAETFEAYLREGKAPSTGLRSVFATFKQWLIRIYKSITQIGSRVRINDEIRAVFDRMLATDDAIRAATETQERTSEQMAQALLDKGVITERAFERTKERLLAARERAEAELMARLMEDYERSQKAWWRDEERQVRREVQSEVDERPEQRAFAWLTGKGWRATQADAIEAAAAAAEDMEALQQTAYDLNTPEARAEWVETETVQSGIPGETTDAKQWGFKLDDGTGIVVSVAPDPNGESVIEWTFLERLKARENVTDLYSQDGPPLSVSQLKQLLVRVAAIIEADMRESGRDAYTFTPATKAIGRINARLLKFIQGGPYEIVEFPGADASSEVLVLHDEASIAQNGRIIPRPQNQGRKLQWDSGENVEERQDAFYAEVDAITLGSRAGRRAGTGDDGTGSQPGAEVRQPELAYLDTNATDASITQLAQRMIADNRIPAILLFKTDAGRVIAFSGEEVEYSHDLARQLLGLGDLKLQHGVWNPRKWPTLAEMNAAGEVAWYGTSGAAADAQGAELGQSGGPPKPPGGDKIAEARQRTVEQGDLQGYKDWVAKYWPNIQPKAAESMFLVEAVNANSLPKMIARLPRDAQQKIAAISDEVELAAEFRRQWPLMQLDAAREGASKFLRAKSPTPPTGRGGDLAQAGDGRTSPPPSLPPMRLDLSAVEEQYGPEALNSLPPEVRAYSAAATDADQFVQIAADVRKSLKRKKPKDDDIEGRLQREWATAWEKWFDEQGIDIYEKDPAVLRSQIETALTSDVENAISPDEAAPFFNMPDGNALLQGLKEGPRRNQIIRRLTQQRMIERHGDPFRDGTIMREAEKFARNEVQQRQFEIELEALARAAGQQFAGNLAKQQAQENLRTKQVREVLNYNQWLTLEQRWGKKALEAASKGDTAKAAEYARYRMVNFHMYREGRKLAEDIEKTRRHLIDYGKKTKVQRLYAAGPEYADQMAGLLDDYQLRNESRRQERGRASRAQWLQAQMAAIDPYAAYQDPTKTPDEQRVAAAEALDRSQALSALAEGVEARNYKSLIVEELMAVKAEADMIWRLATLKDRLIKEGERRRLSLAGEDIAAEIETNQPNEKPPEPLETDTAGEIVKSSAMKYFAMHRTLQSLAHQFAGGKEGGVFWRYIVRPLNEAFSRLSTLRKTMGDDVAKLYGAFTKAEQERFYRDRRRFNGIGRSLTTQGRLAVALNWGNAVNRKRIMDAYGWNESQVQEVLDSLSKRDWDWVQSVWDYLDTWFPEADRVHQAVHGAPMTKEAPLEIATRYGIYKGGYYPIKFDPKLSSKTGQRAIQADALKQTGNVGQRRKEGYTRERAKGKVTLPIRLSALDVITQHLDEVARSIATEETLFDVGRIVRQKSVEDAIVNRHGRQIYNTIVSQLVTAKFGMEGTSGLLAHLRNGATVVGLAWKASTAALQMLGVSNSIVRVGGPWIAKGYARMGKDAATLQSSADWIMERSEFMRHRRQQQSPEMASLLDAVKNKWTPGFVARIVPRQARAAHRWMVRNGFALMANTQFYSVDMPTWYGAYFKALHYGAEASDAIALADQAVVDAQGGGEIHQLAAMQSGAGTKYAALLRILTNFMSYMITTYNLGVQRVRNARTAGQLAALSMDMILLAALPVAGKMVLDAVTRGIGADDEPEDWLERYLREQVAFLFGPFVGVSQFAGSARGEDSYGYKGPAGLAIFSEANQMGSALAEGDFDQSFWRPANRALGMVFHYPAGQVDASVRGSLALWNGETDNPAAVFFGPTPAN